MEKNESSGSGLGGVGVWGGDVLRESGGEGERETERGRVRERCVERERDKTDTEGVMTSNVLRGGARMWLREGAD